MRKILIISAAVLLLAMLTTVLIAWISALTWHDVAKWKRGDVFEVRPDYVESLPLDGEPIYFRVADIYDSALPPALWRAHVRDAPGAQRIFSYWLDQGALGAQRESPAGVYAPEWVSPDEPVLLWPVPEHLAPAWAAEVARPFPGQHSLTDWRVEDARGWPWPALHGGFDVKVEDLSFRGGTTNCASGTIHTVRGALVLPLERGSVKRPVENTRMLPLLPVWPGFALDTAVYAVFWSIPVGGFLLATHLRRRSWLRQHRCPECGYRLGYRVHEGCPECGWERIGEST